jgi:hypothetical protein
MSSVDNRVVQMKFDNAQFQQGVADTNKSLENLKQGLDLGGAAKSLDGLNAAGSRFSLAGIANGVEQISAKFSTMSIVAITALTNIVNKAVNAGIDIAKSLTIDPIAEGYNDYQAKLTSVQTIMNATGKSIGVVDGYFKQLDTYADKTIYNLTDMTGAFAKFTNAGVGMDKSVPAIKGIANMTALAGQDAGAASIAMYNLSQSIAGGFLTTTDYKSLNLANIATKEWKDHMIEAAVSAGKLEKVGDKYHIAGTKAGAAATGAELFNDELKEGWASTEVLMKVLGDYGDTNTAIGKKAQAAAQDVKSWGMMMETLSAGVGTGWTDTFEILIGNVEEAKKIFTPLTNGIGGVLDEMSKARNEPLVEWKKLGGRTILIDALKSALINLMRIVNPIKAAFTEIFPATTGKDLLNITKTFKTFMDSLIPAPRTIANIKSTAKGFFAAIDIGRMVIGGIVGVIARFIGSMRGAGGGVLDTTAKIGDFIVKLRDSIKNGQGLTDFFKKIDDVLRGVGDSIRNAGQWLGGLFKGVEKIDTSGAVNALSNIKIAIHPLESSGDHLRTVWEKLGDVFRGVFEFLKPMGEKIGEWVRGVGDTIGNAMGNMDWNLVLDGINTGLFAGLVLLVRKFFTGGFQKEADGGGIIQHLKDVFGGITDTLGQMQNTLKAGTLLAIAGAIALLAVSAVALAGVDSGKLTAALGAMAILFTELLTAMSVFEKINPNASVKNMIAIGIGMILLATAIRILVSSVEALSKLSWEELLKGLVGVTALLGGLAGAMKLMNGQSGKMASTGVGLILLAIAVKILASAVGDFAGMDWQKMMQGLIGVGIVLGGLALFTQVVKVSKGSMASSAGLILLGVALKIIASAVNDFANMDAGTIQQGLGSVIVILGALAGFSRAVNPAGMVGMGVAMVIIGGALKILASAITDIGKIPIDTLMTGLLGMVGVLAVIAATMNVMPKGMIVSAVGLAIVAGSLLILSDVLKKMGGMSWEEIGKGLTVLAGSLLILAGAMYLMSGALLGATALLVVVAALTLLVPVLQTLGGMSWETIGTGLGALAATLGVLAVAGLVLGVLSPLFALFGASLILIGAGALLAGVGLLAFSVGITAIALAGAAGTASLVTMVMALAAMLPAIMVQVGLALVAFANVIATSAPAFGVAIMAVLTTLLNIINQMAPQIVATLWNLVVLLVETLVRGIPYLVNAGFRLLIGILDGIANNIGRVVTSATNIIVNFINGIANNLGRVIQAGANLIIKFIEGIGNQIGPLLQAGANLILKFVNGLADTIRNNTAAMKTAGGNLADAIIQGMTGGIGDGVKSVIDAAVNLGKSALDAAKNILGIKSPSRRFREVGEWSAEGMAIGLTTTAGMVAKAAEGVGNTALHALSNSLSNVSSIAASDMDMSPTIRPVLDLSEIRKDSGLIGGILDNKALALNGTYAKATVLSNGQLANQESVATKSTTMPATGDTLNFTQINNSPKALSPADIYRNTNNQISVAKGALTKSRAK